MVRLVKSKLNRKNRFKEQQLLYVDTEKGLILSFPRVMTQSLIQALPRKQLVQAFLEANKETNNRVSSNYNQY